MPNVMTVSVSHIRHALQESYSAQEAANLSRIVCCEMLGQTAVDYYLGKDMILSPKEMQDLDTILARLRNFEPIQYVQGTARFMERSYYVAPGVLIPRPETEELVEVMLKEVPSGARILDIGTGSGCIAISLSKMLPDAKVTAWDISDTALRIARRNNEALQTSVCFVQRDVLAYVPGSGERYDVIVSNPPYIPSADCLTLQEEVRREPLMALDGGTDGLNFYRRIASDAPKFLRPGGVLLLEVGFDQAEAVMALLADFADVQAHEDYQHIPRMIEARKHV